ncbi:hypothetical protein [Streptomyces cellulosae]|uniref:Lipoprotein n=1 Tax=Streptomyces cellulosae TaxID=1968 RepID=A0ABW7Y2L1_STRCE
MKTSTAGRRAGWGGAALTVAAALTLTACGQQRATSGPGSTPSASVTASASATPTPTPPASASVSAPAFAGSSPYVEPGAGDGAPHYNENNAGRRAGEMSPASASDASREAARIEPVLKRLWQEQKWDPATVRRALLGLGYEEERTGANGERLDGTLTVRPMPARFETDHYVTPEGAEIGLRVHADACVTAFTQKSNYQVSTNGPYPESGCFEPPFAH